jgi:hypothetical protein
VYALQSVVITFHFKLDSGQIELLAQTFKIDEVVLDVVQKFPLEAQEKNSQFMVPTHGRLPFVCADLGSIERALCNLIVTRSVVRRMTGRFKCACRTSIKNCGCH